MLNDSLIRTNYIILSFWIFFTGLSCEGRKEPTKSTVELRAIVTSFVNEASKRGLKIDTSRNSLQVGFGKVESKAGSCKPNSSPKILTIDSTMWRHLSIPQKEMLVFHELAHCTLGRRHNNEVLKFGECKSWMREDDFTCNINSINAVWRAYYIDELFSKETLAKPNWYDVNKIADLNRKSKIIASNQIVKTKLNSLLFDSLIFGIEKDWVINFNFQTKNTGSFFITINEYAVSSNSYEVFSSEQQSKTLEFTRSLYLKQYEYTRDKNVLSTDILKPTTEKTELSIKKTGKTIFVFFDNELRLCIPISNNKIKMIGYEDFKEGGCSVNAYTLSL